MGLLGNVVSGAIGYGISEASKSHPLRDLIDQKICHNGNGSGKSIRDVVEEYAKAHGIYTQNNAFAHELQKLADQYKEYDYDRRY